MEEIKILVADDQRLVREGIASLLSIQDGIKVIGTADNGKKAVEMAESLKPDIILMDIRMPVMDGILAAREIQKKGILSQIIMLTTFNDDEYIIKSLQAGAVGYLLKDIPPLDLGDAVKMAHKGVYQLSSAVTGRLVGKLEDFKQDRHPVAEEETQTNREEAFKAVQRLSERERAVLKQIAHGKTNREIADTLFISEGTVKNHVSNILATLDLRDRTQAALFVIKNKITSL
jgi:RNA polymerase sigma factor (sigma-70 family)